ncbi:hypothetical protein K456DRAFT_36458 [Colletotrichum gloeosporioides 23]|nr:hypothetical protein K456DRAFT_36458 [Colletotrichum gloeosporioides 23]
MECGSTAAGWRRVRKSNGAASWATAVELPTIVSCGIRSSVPLSVRTANRRRSLPGAAGTDSLANYGELRNNGRKETSRMAAGPPREHWAAPGTALTQNRKSTFNFLKHIHGISTIQWMSSTERLNPSATVHTQHLLGAPLEGPFEVRRPPATSAGIGRGGIHRYTVRRYTTITSWGTESEYTNGQVPTSRDPKNKIRITGNLQLKLGTRLRIRHRPHKLAPPRPPHPRIPPPSDGEISLCSVISIHPVPIADAAQSPPLPRPCLTFHAVL